MIIFNNNSIGYVLDTDATKVIEAVRSTGVTITPAMMHYAHYLISNMKNIGTWQLSNAVYGFVGGTAASHKWNWKDLRDVDAAFRLTYEGSQTNDSNGIKNNSSAAGNALLTYLNSSNGFNYNNFHFALYTNQASGIVSSDDIGMVGLSGGAEAYVMANNINGTTQRFVCNPGANISLTSSKKTGFFYGGKLNTSVKFLTNNIFNTATGTVSSTTSPVLNIRIGTRTTALNTFETLSSLSRYSFASIGQSFTDTQSIQQSQIVTNAQAILNRL